MQGFGIFSWVAVAVIGLIIFLFCVGFLLFGGEVGKPLLLQSDKVQGLSAVLALILGTAATIGGAVATISVANLGLEISRAQAEREATAFIDERMRNAVERYSSVLSAISNLYASGVILDIRIPHIDRDKLVSDLERQMSSPPPKEIADDLQRLAQAIDNLIIALQSLMQQEFAHQCFREKAKQYPGKLAEIDDHISKLGVPGSERRVTLENLADISALLIVARDRVKNATMGDIITPRLYTNSAEVFGVHYDNRNVRSFFFIGHLLFSRAEAGGQNANQTPYIAAYGSAIVHDLVYAIPDGDWIKKCLLKRYSHITGSDTRLLIDFNPLGVVSNNLQDALSDAEKIGGLYFLSGRKG